MLNNDGSISDHIISFVKQDVPSRGKVYTETDVKKAKNPSNSPENKGCISSLISLVCGDRSGSR